MKITLFSSSSGSRGGGEFYLVGLATGLQSLGHQVLILMSNHESMDGLAAICEDSGIPHERISYTNTYRRRWRSFAAVNDRRTIADTTAILREFPADIIHLNHQNVEDGLDLASAGSCSGIPCVSTVHVTRSMSSLGAVGGRLRDFMARRSWQKCSLPMIGISATSAQDLGDYLQTQVTDIRAASGGDVPNGQPTVYAVPNGVATPTVQNRGLLRAAWNVNETEIVLGCVARLESQKNPTFIARLLPHLGDNVRVVWIGDGRLRHEMEQALRTAGVESHVILDGWQADAPSRLSAFDVFVLPSLYEGLPLALLEAMSAGLPCVVSDVDGTRDAVVEGVTGRLCPVNDVDAWCAALTPLIQTPALRTQLGQAARLRYEAEFSLAAMARRTVDVYSDVIARF